MVRIDKELLYEMLVLPNDKVTRIHLSELDKLITVVLNKYLFSYRDYYDDLRSSATTSVFEKKKNFNPKMDAYNYLFTIIRNETGNEVKRWTKEIFTESCPDTRSQEQSNDFQIYECKVVSNFQKYLTGEKEYDYVRVSREDAMQLLLFLKAYTKPTKAPKEVHELPNTIGTLYNLLQEIWKKIV